MTRLLSVLLVLAVGGCTSAKGAYADGMEHEVAGDYAAAADAYATALERDPTLNNVPGRLSVAGREAVRGYVARARASPPEPSATLYRDADRLVERAARLGVEIERSPTFEADRDAAAVGAVVWLVEAADVLYADGDFAGALDHLARADAFGPSPRRQGEIAELRLASYTEWAEADLAAGRYRDALSRADAALSSGAADDVLNLRDAILDAGTVVAAVLPSEGDDVDAVFLRDLDDVVVEERMAAPPDFVALIDPADVRRWDRRTRRRRAIDFADSPRRLADAASELGADIGVVVAVRSVEVGESVGDAVSEAVERRGGGRATLTTRTVRLAASAEASVIAVGADGRAVCERRAQADAAETYARSTTDAAARDLRLSRAQRDAVADDASAQADRRVRATLRDHLADAVAREVVGCLSAQVP